MSSQRHILFIVPYPFDEAPSQRFRFEQYFRMLEAEGWILSVYPFLSTSGWKIFYQKNKWLIKALLLTRGFGRRFLLLFTLGKYEWVFIHREAAPLGPPVIEWLIAKLFRKKIIYDFDDAIWMTEKGSESGLLRWLKWRQKVSAICAVATKVSAGNNFLATYAKSFNNQVLLNPTTVDTERTVPGPDNKNSVLTIGWTGSHSTLPFLRSIEPVLQTLKRKFKDRISFIIIADVNPNLALESVRFISWGKETEVSDLQQIDIGIMPLPDDEWSKGKCGLKILQYMALGIPAVASAVGANLEMIEHEKDGVLCRGADQWLLHLERLITDSPWREKIGNAGRQKVETHYAVQSNARNFLTLFD